MFQEYPGFHDFCHGTRKKVVEIAKVARWISSWRPTETEIATCHLSANIHFRWILRTFLGGQEYPGFNVSLMLLGKILRDLQVAKVIADGVQLKRKIATRHLSANHIKTCLKLISLVSKEYSWNTRNAQKCT